MRAAIEKHCFVGTGNQFHRPNTINSNYEKVALLKILFIWNQKFGIRFLSV